MSIEAMKLALEALENKFLFIAGDGEAIDLRANAITALRQAIEQAQKQEPVAWLWELTGEVTTDPDRADGLWLPLYTSPPQRQPLTEWVSVDVSLPDAGGYYLVTVATDDGPHVDVLLFNEKRKHWEHEGEPTFCHSYYFEPTHWAHRPEAANGIKGEA